MFPPIFWILGAGAALIGTLAFWSLIQNWMAEVIQRMRDRLGTSADTLLSALVVVDRVVVNGQRVIAATGRAVFQTGDAEPTVIEEVRPLTNEELPADVRKRVEAGEPVSYELSVGSMQVHHVPTYKLAVRRAD
jgi:hypothetical protein